VFVCFLVEFSTVKNQLTADPAVYPELPPSFCLDPNKLLSSVVDVICVIDITGVFRYVSASSSQLFGYSPEEMTDASFLNFIHPEDINGTIQFFANCIPDCVTSHFENRYLHKDGSPISVTWSGRWDENDQLLYCVARDDSKNREVEHRLIKAQQMARVASFEFDMVHNCYTYTSDTLYEIFGLDKAIHAPFTPEHFWARVHPDDVKKVKEKTSLPEHLYSPTLEYRIIRPDGKVVYINRLREVIRDNNGVPIKAIGTIQDITDRKISELAIQQSEERFRSLVQDGNDILGIIDTEGNYLFVAANVEAQLGFSAEELVGKNAFAFIHPDDAGWVATSLQAIDGKQVITIGPFRFLNKKGEWRWLETAVSNHLDNPAIRGLVINSRDITEKKQKEDELRKLSLIAQESQNPILITDLDNKITWANKALYQLCELNALEVIGKQPQEVFLTDEVGAAAHRRIQQDLTTGKSGRQEIRYFSKTGREYWLDLTVQPVYGAHNEVVCVLALGNETTERKKAEIARQEAEQRFRALVQNGSDIIVTLNENIAFTYVSENATLFLGYAPEEVLGQSALDFIHPEDKEKVMLELHKVRTGVDALAVQHRFLHKDGYWVWLESKAANHFENEAIQGMLVNARTVDDRVKLQTRLDQELVNKQREITAAVITAQETERSQLGLELHDNVNQVLTTVKLYNEMYLSGIVQDREVLQKSTHYVQECINEIRSISKRLSAPTLGDISLKDSLQELVDSINLTDRLTITYLYQGFDHCQVSQDLHLAIYRIVQEGLNNILKYSDAQSARIELYKQDSTLYLNIVDDGKGFDPTAKRVGIGLANMKIRAENLNGRFQINSSHNQGCSIEVCFPMNS
jgi:PAS domain S-box-containing protein